MSRALRPMAGRSWVSWGLQSILRFRACSSVSGSRTSVVGSPSVVQSPAWAEWRNSRTEVREEASDGLVGGDMELMAVPKRKVTPSRRGKRNNGNWKLKSVPVIAKCKVCGRTKLPQFYCCDGQMQR